MKNTVLKILLIFLIYIILGACLPFVRQLEVSEYYKNDFDLNKFYANDKSKAYAGLIRDNDQARIERIRAIANAKEKIVLSSYRLRADEAGKLYIASLIDAAKRGVEIDIILDGNTLLVNAGKNNYYKALDSFDNVHIKIYNPMSIIRPWSLNGRMHDKYMIVDDQLAFLGGRNIENRFLITDQNQSYDWDVFLYIENRADNDGIAQLQSYFDNVYNKAKHNKSLEDAAHFANDRKNEEILDELDKLYTQSKNKDPANYSKVDYKNLAVEIKNASLIANPVNEYTKEPIAFYEMTELMLNANDKVNIHTPYYIGNQLIYDKTAQIAANAPTTLFTNSPANNANLVGAGDFLIHKRKFKDLGLRILLNSKENSYHGKAFMVDNDIVGIGSFNWDMRSAYIDTELMMVIYGEDFNHLADKEFDYYENDASFVNEAGELVNPSGDDYVKAGFFKKIISKLFVILFYPFRFLF